MTNFFRQSQYAVLARMSWLNSHTFSARANEIMPSGLVSALYVCFAANIHGSFKRASVAALRDDVRLAIVIFKRKSSVEEFGIVTVFMAGGGDN